MATRKTTVKANVIKCHDDIKFNLGKLTEIANAFDTVGQEKLAKKIWDQVGFINHSLTRLRSSLDE